MLICDIYLYFTVDITIYICLLFMRRLFCRDGKIRYVSGCPFYGALR